MDRYRGGVQVSKGVKVNQHDYGGIDGENNYNSKTLTNQYIIKAGLGSGMPK